MLRCFGVFVATLLFAAQACCQDAGILEAGITLDGVNYNESLAGNSLDNKTITTNLGQRLALTTTFIRTFKKKGLANICSGYLFYRIYDKLSAPPSFSQVNCGQLSEIPSPAQDTQHQEWFNNTINIDLVKDLLPGDYFLDITYGANIFAGANGCHDGPTDFLQNKRAVIRITPALNAQFTGFVTSSNNEFVFLQWQVTDSSDVQYFTVEKSRNAVQWVTLDTIPRNGNSYTFMDSMPATGLNYYRIQAAGFGKKLYSISRRAYVGEIDNFVTVYPNPVVKNLRFEMSALSKGRYQANVYTMNGLKIAEQLIEHDGKDNYVTIPLPSILSRGIYWLVLMTKTEFYKQNFLVQ